MPSPSDRFKIRQNAGAPRVGRWVSRWPNTRRAISRIGSHKSDQIQNRARVVTRHKHPAGRRLRALPPDPPATSQPQTPAAAYCLCACCCYVAVPLCPLPTRSTRSFVTPDAAASLRSHTCRKLRTILDKFWGEESLGRLWQNEQGTGGSQVPRQGSSVYDVNARVCVSPRGADLSMRARTCVCTC